MHTRAPHPPDRLRQLEGLRADHSVSEDQVHTGVACCSGRWPHRGQPAPRRLALSMRPDLISGRDKDAILPIRTLTARPSIHLAGHWRARVLAPDRMLFPPD